MVTVTTCRHPRERAVFEYNEAGDGVRAYCPLCTANLTTVPTDDFHNDKDTAYAALAAMPGKRATT